MNTTTSSSNSNIGIVRVSYATNKVDLSKVDKKYYNLLSIGNKVKVYYRYYKLYNR